MNLRNRLREKSQAKGKEPVTGDSVLCDTIYTQSRETESRKAAAPGTSGREHNERLAWRDFVLFGSDDEIFSNLDCGQ